jgi:hypothetical protein
MLAGPKTQLYPVELNQRFILGGIKCRRGFILKQKFKINWRMMQIVRIALPAAIKKIYPSFSDSLENRKMLLSQASLFSNWGAPLTGVAAQVAVRVGLGIKESAM